MAAARPLFAFLPFLEELWRQECRPMNRLDLSNGVVACHINLDQPLPSAAYPIIATLSEAIETAAAELEEVLTPDEA